VNALKQLLWFAVCYLRRPLNILLERDLSFDVGEWIASAFTGYNTSQVKCFAWLLPQAWTPVTTFTQYSDNTYYFCLISKYSVFI